jgi:hypothetical protein
VTRAVLAVVVSLCVLGLVACPGAPPCSAGDAVIFAHGAECAARVKACGNGDECKAIVRDECNRWGDERCGFASGGEAGAP